MNNLQETQLQVLLRQLLSRLQTIEGATQAALDKSGKADEAIWDLFAQLVEHDHCELCGRAIWGNDHTC